MSERAATPTTLPADLRWLADAPLFIDDERVDGFYDAVVRPETEQGVTTLEINEQTLRHISGKLGLEAGLSMNDLLQMLTSVLPFLKPEIKATAEGEYKHEESTEQAMTVELHPIATPQRQLVQLVLHYLVNLQTRLFLVSNPSTEDWRSPSAIADVPRALAFLNLPGQEEARNSGLPETKLIPLAAEFSNGHVELLYARLRSRDGREMPPHYPEVADSVPDLRAARNTYWQWFDTHFSATQAMNIVEQAAAANGRILWIDYRVPVTSDGETLHLHISPSGKYDTGAFAYNFIKRGHKHGLRLVGTLKSEPDMNVLAIYEK